jgi:hypothetical protein
MNFLRQIGFARWLLSALGSVDLLLDKQELIRNKVLKTKGLCGSDTITLGRCDESHQLWEGKTRRGKWVRSIFCFGREVAESEGIPND